jgi:hypothetical protein
VGDASELVGGWLLERWDYTIDGESRGYPMGEDAVGQILYTSDGRMAAILSMASRPLLTGDQFHKAPSEEREVAALTYVSYGGTYEVEGDVVTHHVEFALFPNWVGTDLVRRISYDADLLVLTGEPETSSTGKTVVNRLFWRRAAASPTQKES